MTADSRIEAITRILRDHRLNICGGPSPWDGLGNAAQAIVDEIDRGDHKIRDTVSIDLTWDEAKNLSYGLSDLLCWCRGFRAALSDDDLDKLPMGIEDARRINELIKQELNRVEDIRL